MGFGDLRRYARGVGLALVVALAFALAGCGDGFTITVAPGGDDAPAAVAVQTAIPETGPETGPASVPTATPAPAAQAGTVQDAAPRANANAFAVVIWTVRNADSGGRHCRC